MYWMNKVFYSSSISLILFNTLCYALIGNILEPLVLLSKLQYILKNNTAPSNYPVGVLTTSERNSWANLRNYLIKLGNEESLRTIDDSLMIIALDDEKPGADPKLCVEQYLHSDGINR